MVPFPIRGRPVLQAAAPPVAAPRIMDALRPLGGPPRPSFLAPGPQRNSRSQKLFRFSRQASHEEFEEQAAERMEFIAAEAAEAKAAARMRRRIAGVPPKRTPWGAPARRHVARQQLVQAERMARQWACSNWRWSGAWRAWSSFGLLLAWWMVERAKDGGPSCKQRGWAIKFASADRLTKQFLPL